MEVIRARYGFSWRPFWIWPRRSQLFNRSISWSHSRSRTSQKLSTGSPARVASRQMARRWRRPSSTTAGRFPSRKPLPVPRNCVKRSSPALPLRSRRRSGTVNESISPRLSGGGGGKPSAGKWCDQWGPGRDTTFAQSGLKTWDGAVGIGFNWALFDGGIDAAQAQSIRSGRAKTING